MFDGVKYRVDYEKALPQAADNSSTVCDKATDLVQDLRQLLAENREHIEQLKNNDNEVNSEDDMFATDLRHRLNLYHAVEVMPNLAFRYKKNEKQYTKSRIENIAVSRVCSILKDRI